MEMHPVFNPIFYEKSGDKIIRFFNWCNRGDIIFVLEHYFYFLRALIKRKVKKAA
jgi:hypothetical protein